LKKLLLVAALLVAPWFAHAQYQPSGGGGGSGGTPGNPTATAGPTAVNGSASTYLRSDAAPAVQTATNSQLGLAEPDGQTTTISSGGKISTTASDRSTSISPVVVGSGDVGGQINWIGSSAGTVSNFTTTTVPAGTSVTLCNQSSAALTLPTAPTINGYTGTTLPAVSGGTATCINLLSNGTLLDAFPAVPGVLAQQTVQTVQGSTDTQSGPTYTMAASDCGKTIVGTDASAATYTIPASIVPASGISCIISVIQAGGSGKISVNGTAVSAATLQSAHGYTGTSGTQWSEITLTLSTIAATTVAVLTGDGS
jgi:hypothetical protein